MIQKGKSVKNEIIKVIEQRKENAAGSENGKKRPVLGSWEICMQVRKKQLELDMEQQTGSK